MTATTYPTRDDVDAARELGAAMAAADRVFEADAYARLQNAAIETARDAGGLGDRGLTARGMIAAAAHLRLAVTMTAQAKPRLHELDPSERDGTTFSIIRDGVETGIVTFPVPHTALSFVRHTLTLDRTGIVPRTPDAVDVLAEVLS